MKTAGKSPPFQCYPETAGLRHRLLQVLIDLVEEGGGREPRLIGADEQRQVLGHEAGFNGVDADLFQRRGELGKFGIVVELGAVGETTGPGEDRCNRVRRGFLTLLMLTIVAGHRTMSGFGFDRLAIGRQQNRGHQPERAEALRDGIGLDVAVVVLAGPDVASGPLQGRGDHVVDQTVFVGDPGFLELILEFGLVDFLEDVLEAAVIGLEDGVLGRQVDRPFAHQAVHHRGAGEFADRFVEVVHGHGNAGARRVEDLLLDDGAVFTDELDRQLALAGELEVGCAVLVAESVTADDDRLRPAGNEARNVAADDRLAEDDAAENVSDRAVRALPHFLEIEFLDAGFIRRDRCALDTDAVFLDGVGGVDRHLVVGGVAIFDREVVIVDIEVEIRMDQLILDELPDDACHFIAVEIGDGIGDLDLLHVSASLSLEGDIVPAG
ncbi:NADP-dependent isocitrate dehydrogenase protein [Rhizobium etli CFN 42]|uniref:NADP-dependent isocitrate dehydrogenase protein n=1 Tax=Rhizobium etli (strain ATCC 51251 / DSM 11541 / JCM 21823 / NBRC 15573 / CFN 42) TaxID=347834 RepID=Q2K7T8_RHIEC|nr:NADP-dependent isocitrate dehydrogenase protein [Rhizobium etli CFN 42]